MAHIYKRFTAMLFCAILSAGCTSNNLIIVVPQQQNPRLLAQKRAILPCRLNAQERTKYIAAVPLTMTPAIIPQKAKDDRVDGCAGIEFQLDADGTPINLHVVKESPINYNFANSLMQHLQQGKFKPSSNPAQWYYVLDGYVTSTMITPRSTPQPQKNI